MSDLIWIGDPSPDEPQVLSADIETTGLEWSNSTILGTSLAWRDEENVIRSAYLMDPAGHAQQSMFLDGTVTNSRHLLDLLNSERRVVMHNHSFDYRFLMREYGLSPLSNLVDTMHLATQVEAQELGRGLATLHTKYCKDSTVLTPGERDFLFATKGNRASLKHLPAPTVAKYARIDAVITLELYEALMRMNPDALKFQSWDSDFQRLVMRMVETGLPMSRDRMLETKASFRRRMLEIQTYLSSRGLRNANAPVQVKKWLISAGVAVDNTQEGTLDGIREDVDSGLDVSMGEVVTAPERVPHIPEVIKAIVDYRQLSKAISSWLDPLLGLTAWDGMNAHTELRPFGTGSYRMSASDINSQGVPMEDRGRAYGNFSHLYYHPEMSVVAYDIKQAEVRLSAIESGDLSLMDTLSVGGDPYVNLAIKMWNDTSRRQDAKQAMLSSIYETGVRTFAITNGVSEALAKEILGSFRNAFPTLRAMSKRYERAAVKVGGIRTCVGRPLWFTQEDLEHAYKAFNQRVQSTVAEVMREAMLRADNSYPGQVLLQVHDSIYMLVEPGQEEEIGEHIEQITNEVVFDLVPNQKRFNGKLSFPIDHKIIHQGEIA